MKRLLLPVSVLALLILAVFLWRDDAGTQKIMAAAGAAAAVAALPWLDRTLGFKLPVWFKVGLTIFVLLSLVLGTIGGMYAVWWPWDNMLHIVSGVLAAAFIIIMLNRSTHRLTKPQAIIMITSFGAALAVAWEIAEYLSDSWFGTFSQRNDLVDTMNDLICGTLGATCTAAFYYAAQTYLTRRRKETIL